MDDFFENYVLPIMAESGDSRETYEYTYLPVINSVLIDCFDINNSLRLAHGLDPLEEIAFYVAGDQLPYEDRLLANCINYGVASRLLVDEAGDEGAMLGFLESNYQRGKARYDTAAYQEINSIWS